MRNGLALPLMFAASVATSVLVTRFMTAASSGSQRPVGQHEQPLAAPTGEPRAAPVVSQRVWAALPAMLPPPAQVTPSPVEPSVGSAAPGQVDLERALFEATQKYDLDAPPDAHAGQITRDMNDALARSVAAGTAMESVECKLKTCRAVLSSSTPTTREATLDKLAADGDGPFAQYGFTILARETTADGRSRASVFVNLP